MAIEINTKVSVGDTFGKQTVGNLTLEDAKFFGRPNFSGEEDRFKDSRKKFTVLIPNDVADQLRDLGWNVKTSVPTPEEQAEGREPISFLKVMVDDVTETSGPDIWVIMGEEREKLTNATMAILDRSRIENLDMELRVWMYNADEVRQGLEEPKYSARLKTLVAVLRPNLLDAKYGRLI
jgi:hypothetical protein